MSAQVKISNTSRVSFRRAGLRFPAKGQGHVIVNADDITQAQQDALSREPRLTLEPYDGNDVVPAPSKAEADHAKAMTAARKMKDPVKRQEAQDKANAALDAAQD